MMRIVTNFFLIMIVMTFLLIMPENLSDFKGFVLDDAAGPTPLRQPRESPELPPLQVFAASGPTRTCK